MSKGYFQPKHDYVHVEPVQVSNLEGGLEVSTIGHSTPVRGKVLQAGPKSKHHQGDIVVFRRYSADEIKLFNSDGEQTVWVVKDDDIIGYWIAEPVPSLLGRITKFLTTY